MSAYDWPNDLGYRPPERIDLGLLNDDNLADEWRHLRGFGWPDERIAERFGLRLESIKRRGQGSRSRRTGGVVTGRRPAETEPSTPSE